MNDANLTDTAKSNLHTPTSLADVLERDYFPMPTGKSLYLSEYEWKMVVAALRGCTGPNSEQLGRALFEAALYWQNDPAAIGRLDEAIEAYRLYATNQKGPA
jgi:hypothetical protein